MKIFRKIKNWRVWFSNCGHRNVDDCLFFHKKTLVIPDKVFFDVKTTDRHEAFRKATDLFWANYELGNGIGFPNFFIEKI